MNIKLFIGLSILVIIGVWSCTSPSDFSEIPEIDFRGFSKNTLLQGRQNQDTVILQIGFKDGDGDLGSNNVLNIEIKDLRLDNSVPFGFLIPEIPDQGAENGITGTMDIKIFSVCCFQGAVSCEPFPDMPEDELRFSVQITDNAGNDSNIIETDPLRLLCL